MLIAKWIKNQFDYVEVANLYPSVTGIENAMLRITTKSYFFFPICKIFPDVKQIHLNLNFSISNSPKYLSGDIFGKLRIKHKRTILQAISFIKLNETQLKKFCNDNTLDTSEFLTSLKMIDFE